MNIPHQNMINLYFRKAFEEYYGGKSAADSFVYWLRELKKRFGKSWTKEDQWYWDVLFEINQRGRDLQKIAEEEKYDPDKEKWIKQQIEDPNGVFSKKKLLFDMRRKKK